MPLNNLDIHSAFKKYYKTITNATTRAGRAEAEKKFPDRKSSQEDNRKSHLRDHWEGFLFCDFLKQEYEKHKSPSQVENENHISEGQKKLLNIFKEIVRSYSWEQTTSGNIVTHGGGFNNDAADSFFKKISQEFKYDINVLFLEFLKLCEGKAISSFFISPEEETEKARALAERQAINDLSQVIRDLEDTLRPPNPYKGLAHFSAADKIYFYGRTDEIKALCDRVERHPFTAVIGPSGCGKSSLVSAGLVPALKDSGNWVTITFRFSNSIENNPFQALALAIAPALSTYQTDFQEVEEKIKISKTLHDAEENLSQFLDTIRRKNDNKKLLIVIDQFEELFTLKISNYLIKQFLNVLLKTFNTIENNHVVSIVITMRRDFLDYTDKFGEFSEKINSNTVPIGFLSGEALKEAIEKPAELSNTEFEEGLVNVIYEDAQDCIESLPLIEFALTELWNQKTNNLMSFSSYEKLGRIYGALTQEAEKIYQKLTEEEKNFAKNIFLKLVNIGEKGVPDSKKLVQRMDFEDDQWRLIQKLANESHRLVTVNEYNNREAAELIHEKLITRWGRLEKWIAEGREFSIWQQKLQISVDDWIIDKNNSDLFLRGAKLEKAKENLANERLTQDQRIFLQNSLKSNQYRTNIKNILTGGAIAASILFAILSFFLYTSSNRIKEQAIAIAHEKNAAETNKNRLLAIKAKDFSEGARNRLAALTALNLLPENNNEPEKDYEVDAKKVLSDLTGRYLEILRIPLNGHRSTFKFSPDGKTLALGNEKGEIHIIDIKSKKTIKSLPKQNSEITDFRYLDNGSILVAKLKNQTKLTYNFSTDQNKIEDDLNTSEKSVNTFFYLPDVWDKNGLSTFNTPKISNYKSLSANAYIQIDEYSLNLPSDIKGNLVGLISDDFFLRIFSKIEYPEFFSTIFSSYNLNKEISASGNLSYVGFATPDNEIEIRNSSDGAKAISVKPNVIGDITALQLNHQGSKALVSYDSGLVIELDIQSNKVINRFSTKSNIYKLIYSDDQKYALAFFGPIFDANKFHYLEFSLKDNAPYKEYIEKSHRDLGHRFYARYSRSLSDFRERYFYNNYPSNTDRYKVDLNRWNSNNNTIKHTISSNVAHDNSYFNIDIPNEVRRFSFSSRDNYFFIESQKKIFIHSMDTRKLLHTFDLSSYSQPINNTFFSENEKLLLVELGYNTLMLYDITSGNLVFKYTALNDLNFLALSPDSNLIAWTENKNKVVVSPIKLFENQKIIDHFRSLNMPPIERNEVDDLLFELIKSS